MDKTTSKKYLAFGSTIAATILLGIYTQSIDWNPAIRTMAHFCGAMTVPSFSSFMTSNFIGIYEDHKNKKISHAKSKENSIDNAQDKYHINPKLKQNLLRAGMFIGSAAYIAFSASWESWQFSQSNVFQLPQYLSDTLAPLVGMATIGTIDSQPLYEKIDNITDKIKSKFAKNKEHSQSQETTLEHSQDIPTKEDLPSWDLRRYGMTRSSFNEQAKDAVNKTISSPQTERTNSNNSFNDILPYL